MSGLTLFSNEDLPMDWEAEWQGMPEFSMGDTRPVQKITVSFSSHADAQEFAERLCIRVSTRTDSIWFPDASNYEAPSLFRYVSDES
jgi:hypothetical protein